MQIIGYLAARFALDADAVKAAVAGAGQRILTPHFLAAHRDAQADELARFIGQNRLPVLGFEIERSDFLAFLLLARHDERARAAPAAGGFGAVVIDLFLQADQDVGQLTVGRAPGRQHLVGGDLGAQDFADRAQQAIADHRIVFRKNLQRDVLADDGADQIPELVQPVDMACVHQ